MPGRTFTVVPAAGYCPSCGGREPGGHDPACGRLAINGAELRAPVLNSANEIKGGSGTNGRNSLYPADSTAILQSPGAPCSDPVIELEKLPERLELTAEDRQLRLESLARQLLETLGEDPARPGLLDTPRRWAAWWLEFMHHKESRTDTVFEAPGSSIVGVRRVRVWSMCEHHLLPFWCDLTMAYVPAGKVLGLSKFARIARQCASKLQLQERLVEEIADYIGEVTGSQDVAVVAEGEHLCLSMRGAKQPEARMFSSVIRGRFETSDRLRQEWMQMVGMGG